MGMNYLDKYVENPFVKENEFLSRLPRITPLPSFETARHKLPQPEWANHPVAIECYWKVWELAFANLKSPTSENGFVASYIDSAFNSHLFMWDSAFITFFGSYGRRAFNFQQTLDNFYARQHPDGFICRELVETDGRDLFHRFDPSSTGPNILPWAEWRYFQMTGDPDRLASVFAPLAGYHQWLRTYRTWPDGSYWANGWSCGMDNQPRLPEHLSPEFSHGHQSWIDTCLQQIFSARVLGKLAKTLGRSADIADLLDEADALARLVNDKMWDDTSAFYYDRQPGGNRSTVKTIGAFWSLLANIVPRRRLSRFVAHLENPKEFKRPHRVPSLSFDHALYQSDGGYWRGGVWPPTNYMIL